MYRKRNDVDMLVKALSGGEKRYFSKFQKLYAQDNGTPMYMELFRLLENQESKQIKSFPGLSEKSLTMTKKRLYNNILRVLRLYHQEKSVSIIIMNILAEVEILFNLSLAEQALFQLRKAHALACEHEKFGLLLQVLEWESRLNVVLDTPTRDQKEIVEEELSAIEKQRQYRFLENRYNIAETLKKQYGFVRGKLAEEMERATIKAEGMPTLAECLSEKARYYHNFTHALYHWMTFGHQKAFEYSQHLVHPNANTIPPGDYINGLLEHITSCVCLGLFQEALSGIRLGTAFIEAEKLTQSHAFTGNMFAYQSTYELIIYNYMGNRKKLQSTIRQTEKKLEHFDTILPFEKKQVITGNLMRACVGTGNLKKADNIWHRMFGNRKSRDVRRDIFADLYLFRLFSILHQGLYSLLASASLSAVRYFTGFDDAEQAFEVELSIARYLQKERDYGKPAVITETAAHLESIVTGFISKTGNRHGFQEHYTYYAIWADAISHKESYYLAAKRWYSNTIK